MKKYDYLLVGGGLFSAVFAYQAITGSISQDFMTIYAVIIAFYFGTQAKETNNGNG